MERTMNDGKRMYPKTTRHLTMNGAWTLAIIGLFVVACTQPAPNTADAEVDPMPLEVVLPRAILPDGATVDLELATTPEETTTGLMYRPSLATDRGMLLLWSEERYATIWMMNVLIPLDIVFLDNAGEVIEIVADARPCAAEPCPRFTPDKPSRAVLELAAGAAAAHGVTVGTSIEFERVPGYPVLNEELARISHQLSAAVGDALHPAGFSRFGVLDVLSSTTPRPSGRKPHWARHLADLATKAGEKCRLGIRN